MAVLLLLGSAFASQLTQERLLQVQSEKMFKLPAKDHRTSENIYHFVDHAIKQKYWYYLTKACLLYLTSVDRGNDSYQFLAIYRNIVGTFLAITTWTKGSSSFEVNTLVRLGNGLAIKYGANYKPVALKPLVARYKLGDHEVIVSFVDCEDIEINGKNIFYDCHGDDCPKKKKLLPDCELLSEYAVEKFWYYLRDSKVVYSSLGKTAEKNYCLITYLNEVGTFFVIGSQKDDSSKHCEVNNFVRLGNGF